MVYQRDPTPVDPHLLLFHTGDTHPMTELRDYLRSTGSECLGGVWEPSGRAVVPLRLRRTRKWFAVGGARR